MGEVEVTTGPRTPLARWRGPVGWLFLVSFLLLTPAAFFPSPPSVGSPIGTDKLVHFGLFFGLSRSWYLAIPIRGARRIVWSLLLALSLGAGLEILQTFLGWRSGEVGDALAAALGAVAGILWCRWRTLRAADGS